MRYFVAFSLFTVTVVSLYFVYQASQEETIQEQIVQEQVVQEQIVQEQTVQEPTVQEQVVQEETQDEKIAKTEISRKIEKLSKVKDFEAPEFEIARVEPDGSALIAGKGEAESLVSIFANGKALASVEVDKQKSWLYVTKKPLNDGKKGSVTLTISGTSKDGKNHKWSTQVLTVFVEGGKVRPIVIVQRPNMPTIVVQKPTSDKILSQINIDTLDYIENQSLIAVTGTAPPLMQLRLYLNNIFQADISTDERGYFKKQKKIKPIKNGKHTIRIDGIDENGKVKQRIEVSFLKEIDENIHVNIVKGDNLWNIARRLYGDGFRYTVIYQANKHTIKDPDLIYPGQVFVTPRNIK